MRVLHAIAGAEVGGAETFFVDAVTATNELNIKQHVVTRNNSPYKTDTITQLGIPLNTTSFANGIKWPTKRVLKKTINEFNPDIVHNWMGRAGTYAIDGPHINIGWYGGYYKPTRFKNCHHHVAVTKDIADHIIRQGVDSKQVHVLHIYAQFKEAKPINRIKYNTPNDVPLLLSLSRLHTKKGLDILISAMQQVPDAYLWIAGSGPLEQELKTQMHDLKLEKRIRFLGWVYDREALLTTADICVFPSRYEPFGAVVIEAWATGTPLITAKAQGPKAYVSHEENGLLVNIDDIDGLAHAINRMINDKYLQAHMIYNGIKHYEQNFTKEVYKRNVQELYNSVTR